MITPESIKQFAQDVAGVWLPKAPVSLLRNAQPDENGDSTAKNLNKIQFFEDTFLEFVEDGAFYFTIPVVGTMMGGLIAAVQQKLDKNFTHNGKVIGYKDIGKSWKDLGYANLAKAKVPAHLLGAKSGALIGAVGSAFAFEYMIQHWKNVITAKKFHTTNFTAVAGLEKSRTNIAPGEDDPVAKASKRGKQVAALWATSLGVAVAAPWLFKQFVKEESKKIPKVLQYFNFGSSGKSLYDTHKGFQALLVTVGMFSYLDAARDKLEFKEQATRLSVVIPYLLFGQAVAGNLLAKGLERVPFFKDKSGERVNLKKLELDLLDKGGQNSTLKAMWQKSKKPETFFNLDLLKGKEDFGKAVDALVSTNGVNKITAETAKSIKKLHGAGMYWGSLALGAAVAGVGINLVAYHQTNQRHKKQQEEKVGDQPNPSVQPQTAQTVFQSYGGFAAQGKPLEDPAAAAAIAAPRRQVQTPYYNARQSVNPYGYGQWRV